MRKILLLTGLMISTLSFAGTVDFHFRGERLMNVKVDSFSIDNSIVATAETPDNDLKTFNNVCSKIGCLQIGTTSGLSCHIPLNMLKVRGLDPLQLGRALLAKEEGKGSRLSLSCYLNRGDKKPFDLARSIRIMGF